MNFGNIVIMMSKFGSKSGDFAQRGGDRTVAQKTFLDEFVKRDLNNVTSLNNLQWRIKGQKLTKEKVVEYLSSTEGKIAVE